MKFATKFQLYRDGIHFRNDEKEGYKLKHVQTKVMQSLVDKLLQVFPMEKLPSQADDMLDHYEQSLEVFSSVEWVGFAQAFLAANPPAGLKAMFKSLIRDIGSVPELAQAAEEPDMAQKIKAQTIAALSRGFAVPSPAALTEAGLDPKMHGQVTYEDPWWETCYKVFCVSYEFTQPTQMRVWAVTDPYDNTPRGSFKGQFYIQDARLQKALNRLRDTPETIRNAIWSPVMDGGWNTSDTQPLVTSL